MSSPLSGFEIEPSRLNEIRDAWDTQKDAVRSLVVDFYLFRGPGLPGLDAYSDEKLASTLSALQEKAPDKPVHQIAGEASTSLFGCELSESIRARFAFNGKRIRESMGRDTQVSADGYRVLTDEANHNVSIHDRANSRRAILGQRDFRYQPSGILIDKVQEILPDPQRPDRATLVALLDNGNNARCDVALQTGDVFEFRYTRAGTDSPETQIIQRDFRAFAGGIRMPFLKLTIQYDQQGSPNFAELILVRSMQVNVDVPGETFVVPAPPDAVVFDYRGRGESPPRSYRVDHIGENDVVKFANEQHAQAKELLERREQIGTPNGDVKRADERSAHAEERVAAPIPAKNGSYAFIVVVLNVVVLAAISGAVYVYRRRHS